MIVPDINRSSGIPSHAASRASVALSGVPIPFSIRDNVDALTPVSVATDRSDARFSSRRRLMYSPSSTTFINDSAMVQFLLTPRPTYTTKQYRPQHFILYLKQESDVLYSVPQMRRARPGCCLAPISIEQ